MERSSERALYTARTNSRLPVIPHTCPPPHLFDLQLKMPPTPQHWGQPHPPALPSPNPGLHLFLLGPAIQSVLRIRDVYPGSRILIFTYPGSRISDPGSRIQKQQQKRESAEEKNLGKFSKNYRTFYQKNCQKALKNMVLGSGI